MTRIACKRHARLLMRRREREAIGRPNMCTFAVNGIGALGLRVLHGREHSLDITLPKIRRLLLG